MGGEGGGEHRSQRRHRAVHQTHKAGLDHLQHETFLRVLVLAGPSVAGQALLLRLAGAALVAHFILGDVAEQLADGRVGRAGGGLPVEALGVALHRGRLPAHRLDPQRAHLPQGLACDVALHVGAPHQRNVCAEACGEEVDELAAMAALLVGHVVEHPGRLGIVVP